MTVEARPLRPEGDRAARRRRAFRNAVREALGLPSLVLGASFLGFGSLVRGTGLDLWLGLFATGAIWALPGQVVLVELHGAGASLLVAAVAVALTNARMLPMTITLMPLLRDGRSPRAVHYVLAHMVAVTGWAVALQRCPQMPEDERLPWFAGFSATVWAVGTAATAAGFALAGVVPGPVTLGLVFLNPLYFMLVFAVDLRQRAKVWALCLGAVLGPPLHLASPDWGLMATGLVAGTGAFLLARRGRAHA